MQTKQIIQRVEELALPFCKEIGVSLWDVEFEKEGGAYMLTITVDHPEGVNIDQCEFVSRGIDPLLDAKEFDGMPSYTLCVSSAGLSRKLKKKEHFEQFNGQEIEIGTYRPIKKSKLHIGALVSYDDGTITLQNGSETLVFEPKDIAVVRLAVQV